MIDIHCHILAGIDDGASTIEDSLEMAKDAASQGIHTIIATPHHRNGTYDNEKKDILSYVEDLNCTLDEADINLTILPGQETRIHGELIEHLEDGTLLPLNESSGYLFVELPSSQVPRYTGRMLFDIQVQGLTPVIVHPERNKQIMENPDILYEFVQKGTLTQVTAASIAGKFGKKIQKFSHQLIEANLAHFIASDAHNTTSRGFCMAEAYSVIKDRYGQALVYELMENAQLLIEGETVIGNPPEQIQKKKFLGLF